MEDKIVAGVTALIGLAAMIFGMSQDVVSTLQAAVPSVVGGVMTIVSVVTYLVNRRKAKEAVFEALAYKQGECDANGSLRAPAAIDKENERVLSIAKSVGLV